MRVTVYDDCFEAFNRIIDMNGLRSHNSFLAWMPLIYYLSRVALLSLSSMPSPSSHILLCFLAPSPPRCWPSTPSAPHSSTLTVASSPRSIRLLRLPLLDRFAVRDMSPFRPSSASSLLYTNTFSQALTPGMHALQILLLGNRHDPRHEESR